MSLRARHKGVRGGRGRPLSGRVSVPRPPHPRPQSQGGMAEEAPRTPQPAPGPHSPRAWAERLTGDRDRTVSSGTLVSSPSNVTTWFFASCLLWLYLGALGRRDFHSHFTVVATEAHRREDFLDQGHPGSLGWPTTLSSQPGGPALSCLQAPQLGSSACPPVSAGTGPPLF